MVENLNLIVVKWGTAYGPEYVVNLYNGVKKHTNLPFNFYVFTDDASDLPKNKNWNFIKLLEWNVMHSKGWWYKMEIFNKEHNLLGINLYLDLDVVITGDLASFWHMVKTDDLYICQDFNRYLIPNYQGYNSSVMAWKNNNLDRYYRMFARDPKTFMRKFRGDQDFLQAYAADRIFWPKYWAMSWKWECYNKDESNKSQTLLNSDTKILVFHGQPKPPNCLDPKIVNLWKS